MRDGGAIDNLESVCRVPTGVSVGSALLGFSAAMPYRGVGTGRREKEKEKGANTWFFRAHPCRCAGTHSETVLGRRQERAKTAISGFCLAPGAQYIYQRVLSVESGTPWNMHGPDHHSHLLPREKGIVQLPSRRPDMHKQQPRNRRSIFPSRLYAYRFVPPVLRLSPLDRSPPPSPFCSAVSVHPANLEATRGACFLLSHPAAPGRPPSRALQMERPSPLSRGVDTLCPVAADFGFPSPASEDIPPNTPSLDDRAGNALSGASPFVPATAAVATVPENVQCPAIQSPAYEVQPSLLEFDTVVGASVNPVSVSESGSRLLPATSPTKAGPRRLRLPSFALLGITAPSPADSTEQPNGDSNFLNPLGRNLDSCGRLLHENFSSSSHPLLDGPDGERQAVPSALSSPKAQARVVHNPLHQYVTTITPPDDSGRLIWNSISTVATGAMDSPATDPGAASTTPEQPAVAGSSSTGPQIRIQHASPPEESEPWLNGAIDTMCKRVSDVGLRCPLNAVSSIEPSVRRAS